MKYRTWAPFRKNASRKIGRQSSCGAERLNVRRPTAWPQHAHLNQPEPGAMIIGTIFRNYTKVQRLKIATNQSAIAKFPIRHLFREKIRARFST